VDSFKILWAPNNITLHPTELRLIALYHYLK